MSHHLRNALMGEYPNLRIDPAKAKISEGTLASVMLEQVERVGDFISLKWLLQDRFFPDYCNWDDELILCAYDVEAGNAAVNEQQVIRKDARMTLELPSVLKGKQVHLYLMLHDRDKQKVSRSEYLGKF